jgi:hypothetical protein
MLTKLNTFLLCLVIALQIYSLRRHTQNHLQVGRFQWLESPGKQLGFDTVTGQRCWIWSDVSKPDTLPPSDVPLCSDLARK